MMVFLHKVFVSLESTPDQLFQSDAGKYALIGLMRDLQGIAMATNRLSLKYLAFETILFAKALQVNYF